MPRKRNLNPVSQKSEVTGVPAELASEKTSRRKSTRVTAATPEIEQAAAPVSQVPVAKPVRKATNGKTAKLDADARAPKAVVTPNSGNGAQNGAGAHGQSSATASFDISLYQDEIAELAYSMWEARGYAHGSPDEDWYSAEAEVRRRYEKTSSAAA